MVHVFQREHLARYIPAPEMASNEPDSKEPDPQTVALGKRIRRLREKLGPNRKEFSRLLGIHENTLGSWERGEKEMRAVDLPRLASALQVDLDVLLGVRSELLRLGAVRTSSTYLVRRDVVRRIQTAKTISDLKDLFNKGIQVGHEVEPDAEEVTTEEWGRIMSIVDAKLASLGQIPEDW